ncbi:processed acidic surface protein [Planococcus lenghuensis]|uniref:Processed acidic surface protein n=1 Tax=Planococcus lenghuensis TaxID=2213202 RepID=A0A1Q2KYY7_9BACL|nr:processed acidic surface protein [Planococcus lenghuensis]AQQ53420.1 processed acidic surface protein [Planococcus lenghuensis]
MSKRTNKILPTALATTLAFGAAPFAVNAEIDLDSLNETTPATADWTEDDWNTYLGENFGTDLSEYESNDELLGELGAPVDINAWISDQSDANVLEAMERYGVTGDELAAILEENDSLEDIHFVGDLENVLEDEGYTDATADEEVVEEEAVVDEETAIDDEVADAEVYDDDVVESEGEDEIVDDEEAAAAGEETGFDYGEVDQAQLEEVYLTPLGMTAEEFDGYLMDNYGMGIADFESFDVLETTVGPFIDVNELITDVEDGTVDDAGVVGLMDEYGLDAAETEEFLTGIEDPDAINFYADLEAELIAAGYSDSTGEDDETGTDEDVVDEEETATDEEETTKDGEVIETGLDMTLVEETYLTPYGWAEDDFNTYLMDNYDMELTDFNDFAELEATVGPLLDDETLSATLYEYDLTEDDYNTFLEDNGFTEDDFVFVADLEWALEDAGYTVVNEVDGEEMPDTATNAVQNALIGTGIALLGAAAFFMSRRREGQQ